MKQKSFKKALKTVSVLRRNCSYIKSSSDMLQKINFLH